MSEQLPYDEQLKQQLSNLPLPDEETAWQKMKLLLDKKNDDDDIVPPVFFKGCLGWGALLLLLLIAVWLGFNANKKHEKTKQQTITEQPDSAKTFSKNDSPITTSISGSNKKNALDTSYIIHKQNGAIPLHSISKKSIDRIDAPGNNKMSALNNNKKISQTPQQIISFTKNKKELIPKNSIKNLQDYRDQQTKKQISKDIPNSTNKKPANVNDSLLIRENINADSTLTVSKDSLPKDFKNIDTTVIEQKEKDKKAKSFYFSAGLALQQQIPLKGQKAYSYNYYGRKGSLTGYIPSLFVRYYKDKKWFLQAEFRYGAPQFTKNINYSESILRDSGNAFSRYTTMRVKKTFYHQAALSFNHYIKPGWSVGLVLCTVAFTGLLQKQKAVTQTIKHKLSP